jgi:hypothetical protein
MIVIYKSFNLITYFVGARPIAGSGIYNRVAQFPDCTVVISTVAHINLEKFRKWWSAFGVWVLLEKNYIKISFLFYKTR